MTYPIDVTRLFQLLLHQPEPLSDDEVVVFDQLAAQLTPVAPSNALRERILLNATGRAAFVSPVASLFQVAESEARRMLAGLADAAWQVFTQGTALLHVQAGPALAGADVGFVRVEDGVAFPHHDHLGEETTIVVQGTLVEADGTRYPAGSLVRFPADSTHDFHAEGQLIFAVVVWGVRFDDTLDALVHA